MKYILTESQFGILEKFFLNEAVEIQGCRVFKDRNLKEFCDASEKLISDDLESYTPKMENLLKLYFTSDSKIQEIQMEKLSEESPIVVDGFKQINEVTEKLLKNCPNATDVANDLKKKWMSKYNVYFKDIKGNYHLLNRLDTNYTAMAVLITIYYKNLINQVREWTHKKDTPVKLFVQDWVEHFFNPSLPLIDPRKNLEQGPVKGEKLENLPHPSKVFDTVLKPTEIVLENSDYQVKFMKALEEVRNKGFKTEDFFEKMLRENNIDYERYSGDFSFVDMVLGVDFLIRQTRRGEDYWVPVQVKSTFKEKYNLIDKFKCTKVIKPELIKINGKEDFGIGGIRGFKEYFCEEHNYCKASDKEKKFLPSNIDYLSSKEFLDK